MRKTKKDPWDTSKSDHHCPYTEDEITVILSLPPTKKSCDIIAPAIQRSSKAVSMVYRVASIPASEFDKTNRGQDEFFRLVRSVSRRVRWIGHSPIIKYKPAKDD